MSDAHDIVIPVRKLASAAGVVLAPLAWLVPFAIPAPASGQETGTVLVHLADGSQLLLRNWSLSYEISTREQSESLAQAPITRRESKELWLGKRSYPLGTQLEIEYGTAEREREVDGTLRKVAVPAAVSLVLTGAGGKREKLKIVAPDKTLLAPEADKKLLVSARTLELLGESLTGTRRDLCLLSFTSLVECADDPAFRVVRLEFLP